MTAFLRLWEPLRLWHRQRQAQRTRRATQELMAALAQTKPAGQVYVLNRLRRIAPETLFCGPRMDGNGTLLTQQPHFVMHGYAIRTINTPIATRFTDWTENCWN